VLPRSGQRRCRPLVWVEGGDATTLVLPGASAAQTPGGRGLFPRQEGGVLAGRRPCNHICALTEVHEKVRIPKRDEPAHVITRSFGLLPPTPFVLTRTLACARLFRSAIDRCE
jgi:hypothetical protein